MHDELAHYNEAMEKSLADKLFFLDHIPDAVIYVDFGCANGALLQAIHERDRSAILYGIDNNPMQLKVAAGRCPSAIYAPEFDWIETRVTEARGKKVAIFSSVLHEAPELMQGVDEWADYIVIRDMGITTSVAKAEQPYSVSGPLSRSEAFADFVDLKLEKGFRGFDEASLGAAAEFLLKSPYLADPNSPRFAREFAARYPLPSIETMLDMMTDAEFLLKSPYLADPNSPRFAREFAERYPLPSIETMLDMMTDAELVVTHFEHYSLPYIRDRIFREFGFEFPYPTHFKLILKKVA